MMMMEKCIFSPYIFGQTWSTYLHFHINEFGQFFKLRRTKYKCFLSLMTKLINMKVQGLDQV